MSIGFGKKERGKRTVAYCQNLQTTTIYEASLPTIPGKIVQQKVRRLPDHKYQFALEAIKQLQQSGVVRESDSEWRSNVVLVPKPTGKDEVRESTNASRLTGDHNFSQLYRICLDFRELNTCLEFPQQTSFTTADEILYKLKNKVVISMDISSAFFIIPIKEEDFQRVVDFINHRPRKSLGYRTPYEVFFASSEPVAFHH